jgi:nitrile hydratase accessory protein
MSTPTRTAPTGLLPGQPQAEGAPVFAEAWQAQAFAMTHALHARGVFTWPEWAATLTQEIKAAQAAGDPDLGDTYHHHWLAALERLVTEKGVAARQALHATRDAWAHAAARTPHGQPVELRPSDFGGRA